MKPKSITDLLGQAFKAHQSRAQEVLGVLRAPEVTTTLVLQTVDPPASSNYVLPTNALYEPYTLGG